MIHFQFTQEDFFTAGPYDTEPVKQLLLPCVAMSIANAKIAQFVKDRNWLVEDLEKTKDKLYLSIEKLRDRNLELETRINSAPTVYSHSGTAWFESGDGIAHHFTAKLVDKKEVHR